MTRPFLRSLTAVLAVLAVPALAGAQQSVAETPVNVIQVWRACLNPQANRVLKDLCGRPLPTDAIDKKASWTEWTNSFWNPSYSLADSIQHYSANLPINSLTIWQVYFGLDRVQQDSAIMRFGGGEKLFDAAHALAITVKADLTSLALGTARNPDAPGLSPDIAAAFRAAAAADTTRAPDQVFNAAMKSLGNPHRLQLLSQIPAARDSVAEDLLGSAKVASLLKSNEENQALKSAVRQSASSEYASVPTQPVSSTRLSQSGLVWGTTDFVVERVQEQFRLYALQGFAGRLCKDAGERVLHHSCAMIRSEEFGISRPGVSLLRGAVSRDLEALPYTSLSYAYSRYGSHLTRSQAEALQIALGITDFGLQTAQGTDPLLALASLSDRYSQMSVDPAQVSRLPRIFLGLAELYATQFDPLRMRAAEWVGSTPGLLLRYQIMALAANHQPSAQRTAYRLSFEPWNVVPVALAVNDNLQELRKQKTRLDSIRRAEPDSSAEVRQARIQLVRGVFGFVDQVLFETSQIWDENSRIQQARRVSEGVQEVVFPMMDGNYSVGLLALNQQVLGYIDTLSLVVDTAGGRKDTTRARLSAFRNDFTRGITFVSELAEASSADQVNAALTRLTDSGDGFMGKRSGPRMRVSLNAYGGVFGGPAHNQFSGEAAGKERAGFAGLYLPVGLDFTIPRDVGKLGRFGVFLQAVDLGVLASWRLDSDASVEEEPEVGVSQVFSPGAFLVFHVRGAPLSLGYGWAKAPALRTLVDESEEDGEEDEVRVDAVRRGFFIAFDIPLFP